MLTIPAIDPATRDRFHAYAEKAMREAADGTGWVDQDAAYEAAVHEGVDAAYDNPRMQELLSALSARIEPFGWSNSLSQKVIQLTMPGVPDVYQGSELWDDSLVDPDNRRPVDFALRKSWLAELCARDTPPPVDGTGAAKLWVVSRCLRARRDRPGLFTGYTPLPVEGPAHPHLVAFDRGGAITLATRLPVALTAAGGWGGATLITELTAQGDPVLTLRFADPIFSYRAVPVFGTTLDRTALRAGMDAQFPRVAGGGG